MPSMSRPKARSNRDDAGARRKRSNSDTGWNRNIGQASEISTTMQKLEETTMKNQPKGLAVSVALAFSATLAAASVFAQTVDTARIEAGGQNDWLTYHGSYKSHHYSPLDQVNANNVSNLSIAWIHIPGRSTRGVQSMPLVADGVLYYTGSYSRTFALNGATGEVIWSYFPELDEALIKRQTHSPYNRGVAIGEGKVFVGTMDGRLIALDMKTGKPAWETKLIDSQKLTVGFTGAPLYAKGLVVIGAQGGEWPGRGPIFGVDAATGAKKWEFLTVAGTEEAMKTWGAESWRTGGGGGWMPGTYDSETNTIWWGTANPAPLYDWSGPDYKTQGARPGDNLYTSSVIGAKKWEVRFPEPPLASVLSTAGNLVFVPDSRGVLHAYNAETGAELWKHSDGTGHQGGIVSYSAEGKQYIAVTAGFGGMASDDYAPTFGGVYTSMPRDDGALIVYSLK